jgi:hypothetical protein
MELLNLPLPATPKEAEERLHAWIQPGPPGFRPARYLFVHMTEPGDTNVAVVRTPENVLHGFDGWVDDFAEFRRKAAAENLHRVPKALPRNADAVKMFEILSCLLCGLLKFVKELSKSLLCHVHEDLARPNPRFANGKANEITERLESVFAVGRRHTLQLTLSAGALT